MDKQNSNENQDKTIVVFRKFKDDGSIVALFPAFINYPDGGCESYMRVGQHSAANYSHCIEITKPAKPSEYASLARELKSIGYNLVIRQKYIRSRKGILHG